MRLVIRAAAADDIAAAEAWYEEQGGDLAACFLLAVHDVLGSILEHPRMYPVTHRDVRRALVTRFPYVIFFRLAGAEVRIVGCFHAHRDPRTWSRHR